MVADRELKIGVIGAGGRGNLARHAHHPEAGTRLVAGCDIRPETLEAFSSFDADVEA